MLTHTPSYVCTAACCLLLACKDLSTWKAITWQPNQHTHASSRDQHAATSSSSIQSISTKISHEAACHHGWPAWLLTAHCSLLTATTCTPKRHETCTAITYTYAAIRDQHAASSSTSIQAIHTKLHPTAHWPTPCAHAGVRPTVRHTWHLFRSSSKPLHPSNTSTHDTAGMMQQDPRLHHGQQLLLQ